MDVFLFDPLFLSVHQLRCQKDIRKEEEKEKKFFACYSWLLETIPVLSFRLHIQCEYDFDLCPDQELTIYLLTLVFPSKNISSLMVFEAFILNECAQFLLTTLENMFTRME